MSVIFYDAEELAQVAIAAVGGSIASDSGKRTLRQTVAVLAAYSIANAAAYQHTYQEATTPHSEAEIMAAAERPSAVVYHDRKAAKRRAGALAYNAVGNDGTDYLDHATLRGIHSIVTSFLRD